MATASPGSVTPPVKKPLINESMNLKLAVGSMERQKGSTQLLSDVCQEFNLKRRALYDFTSIMERFGCCSRVYNERFIWNGLDLAKHSVALIEKHCTNIDDEREMLSLLDCSKDSSLPHIAQAIIALFLHMQVPTLNIKEVCTFFSESPEKYQTMLRKLYTVTSRLEVGGLLKRTQNSAEIRIVRNDPPQAMRISDLMNTASELKMQKLYEHRREVFQACQTSYDRTMFTSSSSSSCPSSTQQSASETMVV